MDVSVKEKLKMAVLAGDILKVCLYIPLIENIDDILIEDLPLIWYAVNRDQLKLIAALASANVNVDAISPSGETPLMAATKKQDINMVKEIIKCGAKANVQNGAGNTALHFATNRQNMEIAILLIENGADIHLENNFGISCYEVVKGTLAQSIYEAKTRT